MIDNFPEAFDREKTYRSKLLELMAIYLILFADDRVCDTLGGRISVYLGCLGALGRVATLPPHRIPT